jgi:hypothetical protein
MTVSPTFYYLLLQGLAVALVFTLGLSRVPKDRMIPYAAVAGLALNAVLELPEFGPGLCIGSFVWPVLMVAVAGLGRGVRLLLVWAGVLPRPQPPPEPEGPRCGGCGYLLRGLPGRVCPECGRSF